GVGRQAQLHIAAHAVDVDAAAGGQLAGQLHVAGDGAQGERLPRPAAGLDVAGDGFQLGRAALSACPESSMPPLTLSTSSAGVFAWMRALPLIVLTLMSPPARPSITSGALITLTSSDAPRGTCSSSVVGAMRLSPPKLNQPEPEPPRGSTLIDSRSLSPVICSGLAPSPSSPPTWTSLRSQAVTFTEPAILLMLIRVLALAACCSWIGVPASASPMHRHNSRGRQWAVFMGSPRMVISRRGRPAGAIAPVVVRCGAGAVAVPRNPVPVRSPAAVRGGRRPVRWRRRPGADRRASSWPGGSCRPIRQVRWV